MEVTSKNNSKLNFPLKEKYVVLVAPSFVTDFSYPEIIVQLRKLGFDKVVELTFGAKMINRQYHKKLKNSREMVIASVCPGIVETIKSQFPKYRKNLIQVDSPMIATAKICRKIYPKHKIAFISPCNFKKIEAEKTEFVDLVIDYKELGEIFSKNKVGKEKFNGVFFDKFYNDYTKIYPLSGGLSKTAHLRGVVKKEEIKIIDGIVRVGNFLKNPEKRIKFLDVTFCNGGCIGGPCTNQKISIDKKRKRLLKYIEVAKKEEIPEGRVGKIEGARGISFKSRYAG